MRKDDWITKLYYKELSDKVRNNRNTRKTIPGKKESIVILKQYYHCDTIFKAQGFLWLCNKVEDIKYEEII